MKILEYILSDFLTFVILIIVIIGIGVKIFEKRQELALKDEEASLNDFHEIATKFSSNNYTIYILASNSSHYGFTYINGSVVKKFGYVWIKVSSFG